jgi:RimJ/RimL family protein N-acetyltransferase
MIRRARPSDSGALHALQCRLDGQSSWMLLEPGERGATDETLRARLAAQAPGGSFDLVAESDGKALIGWLAVEILPYRRARHVGYLVLGVDETASGRGLGRGLLEAAIGECRTRDVRRLELTVMTDNLRAIGLYLRSGFAMEGVRRRAVVRGGGLVDEYYMSRFIDG